MLKNIQKANLLKYQKKLINNQIFKNNNNKLGVTEKLINLKKSKEIQQLNIEKKRIEEQKRVFVEDINQDNKLFKKIFQIPRFMKYAHLIFVGGILYFIMKSSYCSQYDIQYIYNLQKSIDFLAVSQCSLAGVYLSFSIVNYNQNKYDIKQLKVLTPQKLKIAALCFSSAVGYLYLFDNIHLTTFLLIFFPCQYILYKDFIMAREFTAPQYLYNFKTLYHFYTLILFSLILVNILNFKTERKKSLHTLQNLKIQINNNIQQYKAQEDQIIKQFQKQQELKQKQFQKILEQ